MMYEFNKSEGDACIATELDITPPLGVAKEETTFILDKKYFVT